MLKSLLRFLITFIFIVVLSGKCIAQEQEVCSLTHKMRSISKSGVKDGSGEFALSRAEISLNSTYNLLDKIPLNIGVGVLQFNLNDDSSVDLPDTLQTKNIKLGVHFPVPLTQREDLFIGLEILPSWNSAGDNSFADEAFRVDYSASVILRKSEQFITACGVWFRPGYKNAAIPFFGVRCKPNEKLTFNFLTSEPSISYNITDHTKVLLEFAFLSSEFDVTSGAKKGEIVRISDLEAGVGIEHDFNESIKGNLSIGLAFEQKYEYMNADQEVAPKNSLYTAYRFNLRF